MSRAIDRLVLEDPSVAAAERLAQVASMGGRIALTGGSTPRAAYERLASMDVDWRGCTLWFGDERCVPPDDELSNYAMAKAALLDRIEGERPQVRRIPAERGPHEGAEAYERELREAFADPVPALDLILLGIGPDAHCASLFPNAPALQEQVRLVVGVPQAGLEPWVPRVTLTLPVINAAHEVVFLVAGREKADAVARAFEGEPGPDAPSSLVSPTSGALTVLLDPAAASLIGAADQVTRPPEG
jgi:6-phosphogluconolactonase